MKRVNVLFAVFAHPDDESFGPSGTLIKLAKDGWDIHLMCATKGEDGGDVANLAHIRSTELKKAATIIGAKTLHFLGFKDGQLCAKDYKNISKSINNRVTEIVKKYKGPISVNFMTFEPNGVSGHLDHIAVSYTTTYVFTHPHDWQSENVEIGRLAYFCLCKKQKAEELDYFVYSPAGYPMELIEETVDVSDVLDTKRKAIAAHESQDFEYILSIEEPLIGHEHFFYYKNS